MSLRTSHSDANLVIDEALAVTYSNTIIHGSWGWSNGLNVTGTFYTMREIHRYARKTFRYVGMTFNAAKACAREMRELFTRDIRASYWNNGSWNIDTAGTILMADVACVHVAADGWDVHVNVNEDDVRYAMVNSSVDIDQLFSSEMSRDYGSDAHGSDNEQEEQEEEEEEDS